jgi:hypothetical protein
MRGATATLLRFSRVLLEFLLHLSEVIVHDRQVPPLIQMMKWEISMEDAVLERST